MISLIVRTSSLSCPLPRILRPPLTSCEVERATFFQEALQQNEGKPLEASTIQELIKTFVTLVPFNAMGSLTSLF